MARNSAGPSVKCNMHFSVCFCMGYCSLSNCSSYHLGDVVDFNLGSRYYRAGCHNGWCCTVAGILCYHALVENTMAKLKYVASPYFIFRV